MLFTLRVLSGGMSGSELLLSSGNYRVKTGKNPDSTDSDVNTLNDENKSAITLFIPCDDSDNSYYIDLTENSIASADKNSEFTITCIAAAGSSKTTLFKFNHVVQTDNLIIAIKEQSEEWSDAVIKYVPVMIKESDISSAKNHEKINRKNIFKTLTVSVSVVAILGILAGVAWFNYSQSEQTVKNSLFETVAGSVNPVSIVKDNTNTYYLFAETQRDYDWILQALQKNPRPRDEKIEVILLSAAPEKLTNKFWEKNYQVLTVDLSSPMQPVIKIVAGPELTSEKLKELKLLALKWMPFAQDMLIKTYPKNAVISNAEESLKLIYLPFAKLSTPQGATFSIRAALSDNELFQINQFIENYKIAWGNRYINFDIKLDNDLLKGKSYLNGQQGYVLMGKSHWYFPGL